MSARWTIAARYNNDPAAWLREMRWHWLEGAFPEDEWAPERQWFLAEVLRPDAPNLLAPVDRELQIDPKLWTEPYDNIFDMAPVTNQLRERAFNAGVRARETQTRVYERVFGILAVRRNEREHRAAEQALLMANAHQPPPPSAAPAAASKRSKAKPVAKAKRKPRAKPKRK